jgi:hypothetical protein
MEATPNVLCFKEFEPSKSMPGIPCPVSQFTYNQHLSSKPIDYSLADLNRFKPSFNLLLIHAVGILGVI